MNDLSEDIGLDEPFDLSSIDVISEQSEQVYTGSINGSSLSPDYDLKLHNETMRLIFITVAIIIVLVCITISTILCIYICLNRRRNIKRQINKDDLLLPEPFEKTTNRRLSLTNSFEKNVNSTISSNGTQQSDRINFPSSIPKSLSNIINEKIPTGFYYYDNLDDIPYIDESRPTSYIDITRV